MSEKQLSTTVTCNICNKTMKCITRTHLAQHGHTIETYQLMFPDAAITSEAELHRRATNFRALNNENKGKKRDPEIGRRVSETKQKNKRPAWNKGLKKTPEERAAQSVRVKQQYDSGERVGSNLGKKMSEETKQKLRESTLRINAERSEEEKQKIREKKQHAIEKRRESGWVSPNTGRKLSPEQLTRSREILAQNKIKRTKMSHESCTTIANERGFDVLEFSKNVTPRTVWLKCRTCGDTTNRTTQYLNKCKKDKLFCRTCVPPMSGSSIKEQELCDYIKSIVPRASVISNDRVMLEGKEIDILIPDLKLGFEFNGLYWHSETVYQKHIHHALHKTLFAHNKGIRLITIFEDEWDSKQDIVKSRIAHILNQNKTLCYARECEVGMVDFKTCGEFLEENHIQGPDRSKLRYGAYFDGHLVGIMTFKPSSYVKGGNGSVWELSRFAVRNFTNIPGLASKLLKHFLRDFDNPPLISYADARWSVGNVYKSIGFMYAGRSTPSYWYVRTDSWCEREHRSRHMKHLLLERYPDSDHSKTEWEIMQENGWDRIWDCGTLKYTMNC